ncbi:MULTISPECIES: cytochrome P450 family protein [Streptomyces]|uniref:cytochrome P450 family protein n=1 Tax=Streptomyces TaxID=1883 RepID=UPI000B9E0922|nr:P450-derived glycosyltransferase activator [Streptomyces kasugaensis]
MPTTFTDSELGRHLLTVRGFHFVFGALGDPYAQRLRGDVDVATLGEQVRRRGLVYRSGLGTWVTGHAQLGGQLLRDARLGTRHPGVAGAQDHVHENVWETWRTCHVTPLDSALFTLPAVDHARLAALIRPVLGPTSCPAWGLDVDLAVAEALNALGPDFDLMQDLVRPTVIGSLAAVLGLPDGARTELLRLLPRFGPALDSTLCPPRLPVTRAMTAAVDRVREIVEAAVTDRRAEPAGDAVSALLAAAGEDSRSQQDVVTAGVLITVVGAEVAATTLANAVIALLENRRQWALLCDEPERASDAVEETLRWAPPVSMQGRITQEPVDVGEQTLQADQHVVVLIDAANRDPAVHQHPERFDIYRPRRPEFSHLSLSGATYEDLVAPLVRLQAKSALQAIATRLPGLRADGKVLRRSRSPIVRAPLKLPLVQK